MDPHRDDLSDDKTAGKALTGTFKTTSKRAPAQFSRPTFPEIYDAPEKLISMDIAGGTPRVVYDAQQLYHNHSAWSFVPWHYLTGVINRSIAKTQ
jgi:hypothetical protein